MGDKALSEVLVELLSRDDPPFLGEATEEFGERGFGVLMALLALPAALPLPAAGYSIPFGAGIFALGLGLLLGRKRPWLPRRLLQRRLPRVDEASRGIRLLKRMELLLRPRWSQAGKFLRAVAGVIACLMGALMMIPIPGTNTFPGAVALLLGLGIAYRDGFWISVASLAGLLLLCLYAAVAFGLERFLGILGGRV